MGNVPQSGWTRVLTRTGRYEYQFQGRIPTVRNGKYLEATDYQFLVLDEQGWLYKIPVRLEADAEQEVIQKATTAVSDAPGQGGAVGMNDPMRIAEAQLRAGLEEYRPRPSAPYAELDSYFAVDRARAQELQRLLKP